MTLERFANNASSTLNGAIDNVTTTIIVTDASSFPTFGNFRVLLGTSPATAEILLVTSVSGNTFTVIRAQENTIAQSWADQTAVTHILTKGAVEQLRDFIKGKTLNSELENIGIAHDGYALTWLNSDGYWAARPGSPFSISGNELNTTKTLSIDENGLYASEHGDGLAKLYVNGKLLATTLSAGEIPLTTQGFGYVSDNLQTFTVPEGVTSLKVKMWGPGGGSGNYAGAFGGGPGGFSSGLLSVTPGEVLQLVVGSGGKHPVSSNGNGGNGGWPGGGYGTRGDASGAGGGGFTGIFNTSMTQSNALIIAGGGGGATGYSGGNSAGGGGGLTAGGGVGSNGRGGTQFAGGADGNGSGAPTTTIAVGSNGQSLPQSTINVVSTSGFPTAGIIYVTTSAGRQTVTYTGTTGTTFTGCAGGTGTMSTGGSVAGGTATIASGSNGASLPQSTINVSSTNGFPSSGTLLVFTSAGYQVVRYTGITATTFTGCTLGTGTMSTGNTVTLASAGSAFTGGIAFSDQTSSQPTGDDDGGGGSGYFGGGSGRGDGRSGGGGSGFLHATRITNGVTTTGTNANVNGGSTLPPNTTDINYVAGVGIGGAATGVGGTDGGDGYIVLQWGGITSIDDNSIDFGNTSSISVDDTNISVASAPNGTIILAPGSGTLTLQSAADFTLSSGTSSLVLNTNSVQRIKAYPTGAIVVGPPETWNDTSTEAQAGFTGPIINMSAITGGSIASTANQALLFNNAGFGTIQGHNGVTFRVNTGIAGFFDSNNIFRIGPSSNSATTLHGVSSPFIGADYLYMYNSAGSTWGEIISGGSVHRAALQVLNNAAGGSATSGIALFAGGTSHSTPEYAGMGTIEQSGSATSGLIFTKLLGNGTGFASTGAIWQSGAWTIGRATNNDTSTEAQAGLTGPLLNLTQTTGGTLTTVANQTLLYNIAGVATLQGNAGHNFITGTTSVASTSTSKFITSLGRRVRTTVTTTSLTVVDGYDVIIVGALAAPVTITLPASPTAGDTYIIKDQGGTSATQNITVSGNGNNIDGAASYVINANYQSITVIFANGTWSII